VGNSVCRHHAVRKLREFYRLNKAVFPEQGHVLILVRNPVADWPGLEARLTRLLEEESVKVRKS
jgi:RNase P protein component